MDEEKVIQKSGVERQAEILAAALEKAQTNGGILLNAGQKPYPRLYDKGLVVSPVNAIVMAIHSDNGEFKTNNYTLFNRTQQRGEAIRKGQKGVPFTWNNVQEYKNKENPDDKISRTDYRELADEDKAKYQAVAKQETYTLFNIDQSTMFNVHKEDYDAQIEKYGSQDRGEGYMTKDDKKLRIEVNNFILNVRDNLVAIKKDASGTAIYDQKNDTLRIPSQSVFSSYGDYVQETARLVARATGIPERLGREGFINPNKDKTPSERAQLKEILTVELASAVKMLDFGLPAKMRDDTVRTTIPEAIKYLKEDPSFAEELFHDVNRTVGMIKKAEGGEKIKLLDKPEQDLHKKWDRQFPIDNVPEKFTGIAMVKDDGGKWTLTAKAENEPRFAVHPTYEDVSLFFDVIKNDQDASHVEEFRTQIAQKYYQQLANDPSKAVDLFKSNAPQKAIDLITKVNAFKSKDEKLFLVATLGDERQKPKVLSADNWQRMWLADDMRDYKVHLAAKLYAEELHKKLEEQKRMNSPEQKEKERQEEQIKEEATKQETKAVAAAAFSPMLKQFLDLKKKHPDALLLFRCGDFYETYMKDAQDASKVLGITLTKSNKVKDPEGKPLEMAGFPYHALDTYLPKLVRAGHRVAICDQLEDPRRSAHQSESADNGQKDAQKADKQVKNETEERRSTGMHR